MSSPLLVTTGTSSPAYDAVLVAHVVAGIIGFGSVALTGHYASAARRATAGAISPAVRVYFKPGTNFVARTVWLVPILGFALLALSRGDFGLGDTWVWLGLVLFGVAAGLLEWRVWPGERRLQTILADVGDQSGPGPDVSVAGDFEDVARVGHQVARSVAVVDVCYVAAFVLMFAKP